MELCRWASSSPSHFGGQQAGHAPRHQARTSLPSAARDLLLPNLLCLISCTKYLCFPAPVRASSAAAHPADLNPAGSDGS